MRTAFTSLPPGHGGEPPDAGGAGWPPAPEPDEPPWLVEPLLVAAVLALGLVLIFGWSLA